jgi:hypothetical protein
MADWTSIDTNSLLPGEPVISSTMLAFEENPRAIAEGATGAPRILPEAMSGSVAGETLLFGTGGTGQVFTSAPESEIIVWAGQFRATTTCTVRVRGQYRRIGDSGTPVTFSIAKNGSAIISESTDSTSFQNSAAVDVSLVAGDLVVVSGSGGSGGTPNDPTSSSIQIRDIKYTVGEQRTVGGI